MSDIRKPAFRPMGKQEKPMTEKQRRDWSNTIHGYLYGLLAVETCVNLSEDFVTQQNSLRQFKLYMNKIRSLVIVTQREKELLETIVKQHLDNPLFHVKDHGLVDYDFYEAGFLQGLEGLYTKREKVNESID